MSSSLLVLVCLLICLGAASAATVSWYPAAGCSGTATTTNSVSVGNGATSSCFAVSTLAGATATCASQSGQVGGALQLFASTTCTGTGNAVAVWPTGADGTVCMQITGTVPASISYAKLNCNSAFTTNSISLALVVLLALLAMIAM